MRPSGLSVDADGTDPGMGVRNIFNLSRYVDWIVHLLEVKGLSIDVGSYVVPQVVRALRRLELPC
jgi:hypothetical protein